MRLLGERLNDSYKWDKSRFRSEEQIFIIRNLMVTSVIQKVYAGVSWMVIELCVFFISLCLKIKLVILNSPA